MKQEWAITIRARRVYFRVYRHFYPTLVIPSDPSQLSPIYRLPGDVLYYLATSHLSLADRASLALAGKCFWSVLEGRKLLDRLQWQETTVPNTGEPNNDANKDRLEFLQRLQVRFPNRLLCHPCATFHRRPRTGSWTTLSECDLDSRVFSSYAMLGSTLLPFSRAQEVMNYHRFGPSYGCPIGDIEYIAEGGPEYIFRWQERCLFSAKIVNNELIVKLERSGAFRLDDSSAKEKALSVFRDTLGPWCPAPPLGGQPIESRAGLFVRCNSCGCEKRWILALACEGKPGYGEIRRTAWLNLGACESPYDMKWLRATGSGRPGGVGYSHIDPAQSFYMKYFDDRSPHQLKLKARARTYSIRNRTINWACHFIFFMLILHALAAVGKAIGIF